MARNSITINGVSSSTITGLLIQELPAISRPGVRTEAEEIDGRDGDVITSLGYAAYDKTMSIGLFGNFDINAVADFFNQVSEDVPIVFSNEPDKIYYGRINAQIDFERLARFRTANVTIHVQPFKYSATENAITVTSGSSKVVKNSGNIASRPKITITGTGDVAIKLGTQTLFTVALGDTSASITIDSAIGEAYSGTLNTLMNRSVDGDYDNLKLAPGENTLAWSGGTVSKIVIENYSRWV